MSVMTPAEIARRLRRRFYAYVIPDAPKQVREALAVAQTAVGNFYPPGHEYQRHRELFQRLIDECERMRPLGPGGKHDDRHTPDCGCHAGYSTGATS